MAYRLFGEHLVHQQRRTRSGSGRGIVAGCALSPLLGALYLAPLDKLLDQRVTDHRLVPYVRYMDDFVLLADSRWQLRRAIAAVHRLLSTLGLELHPDKRFIGSFKRGFDFLGYRFHPGRRLRPSRESLRRRQTRARRLQEQGGDWQRLRLYALRCGNISTRDWVQTGQYRSAGEEVYRR